MGDYKITVRLDSAVKIKEDFYIYSVKLYNSNGNLYAETIISATDSESAMVLAHTKMNNVCSSISFFRSDCLLPY